MELFSKIVGQELAKKILSQLFLEKHYPPLLFIGPTGVGKRTTALNFAQVINCPDSSDVEKNECVRCQQIKNLSCFDVKLYFPVPQRRSSPENDSPDDALTFITENLMSYRLGETRPTLSKTNYHPLSVIHHIKNEMAYRPVVCRYKVVIILDVHKIRQESANALLKILEEPQKDTVFILTADRVTQVLPTIRSRCQLIFFRKLIPSEIKNYLIDQKNINENQAELASKFANGRIRNALIFLSEPQKLLPNEEFIDLLDRAKTSSDKFVMAIANNEVLCNDLAIETMLSSALFLYRQALFYKLNIPITYRHSFIEKISKKLGYSELLVRIDNILNLINEIDLNLNRKLIIFHLSTKLRV
ncbi:MAG: hypothetical protein ABIK10_01835 [candidate division WOR-3 bacterium]